MTRLTSKRALVTAAGQGIGRAIGEAFLAEGASVFAVDREAALLGAFDLPIVHDLTAAGAAEAIFAQTGPVDILVNAGGMVHAGTIVDCTRSDWDAAFALNVTAMFELARAYLPAMVERGGRFDRQYRFGRLVDHRRAEPVCLWRFQGAP